MEKKSTGKPGRIWFRNWNQRTLSSKSFLCMVFSLLMCRQILSRFSISLEAWTNIAFLIDRWKDEKETSQDLGSSLVGFTSQPIIEIYSYYGAKVKYDYELYHTIWKWYYSFSLSYEWMNNLQIAIYFAFLGMYTRWLFFLAAFGLTLQLIDFR
jgi:hypothetical protein